ncbi:MAG: efflux RND transporter permease subunit [bacterium]
MKIVEFSTKRPVTVVMFTAAIVIFGLISFNNLAINLLPDIAFPTLTIRTEYPGSAPGEVENLISKPIEEAVGVVGGVVRVSSISRAGLSDVIIEFNWGTNMDFAAIDIREKLDGVNLPKDAKKPVLLRFDPSLDPIMRISLYGDENLVALRLLAEEDIKRQLENIEGVASIRVSGGLEEEVHVEIQEAKLARMGIPIAQVINRLSQENVNLTGGTLKDGEAEYLVRTLNQFKSVDEIGDIVVGESGSAAVALKDVARVIRGNRDRNVITRTNGVESVEIAVFKEADTNTVAVASAVKDRLRKIAGEIGRFSDKIKLEVVFDQSRFIRQSIREVLETAIWGGILAIFILYFFLRNLRSTSIISLSIPISVIAAFFLMFLSKTSLNIMSLGGLALGIGMLVDNSIVVLESIGRYWAKGNTLLESANLGASEVGRAVTASTLTTICVFVPVIFVQGVAGQLFVDMALTVTYSLLASLAVALTLIPMLSSIQLVENPAPGNSRKDGLNPQSPLVKVLVSPFKLAKSVASGIGRGISFLLSPFYFAFDRAYSSLSRVYPRSLRWALSHKALVLLAAAGGFLICVSLAGFLGTELIPEVSQGEFTVDVRAPVGTPLSATDDILRYMEGVSLNRSDVKMVYSIAGSSGGFSASSAEEKENVGQLNIALKEGRRGRFEEAAMEDLRARFRDIPGIEYKFSRPSLFTFKSPIEVEIKGYNLQGLEEISQNIAERLRAIPGITDVKSSTEGGNPEIQIAFNRERIASMGLDVESIARVIREKIQGEVATELSSKDRKIDIRVRTRDEDRGGIDNLYRLAVNSDGGVTIPLASVADIKVERGPGEIRRVDQERVAIISANLTGRDLGSAVRDIERAISTLPISRDYTVSIGGQRQEMALSFASMRFAIILAVFLVYLVMAAQFESLLHPLVIMFTIPFGLIGVVLILLLTRVAISVVVLIGVIMMAGIVVNNAIVLVDYINRLRKDGMGKMEAIVEACEVRLRPILMTTSTTVLGLLPMALGFGEGAEIRSPMAITVIGGLTISTLLTLILIPTVYAALDRRG